MVVGFLNAVKSVSPHQVVHVSFGLVQGCVFVFGTAVDGFDVGSEVEELFDVMEIKRRQTIFAEDLVGAARHKNDGVNCIDIFIFS